MSRVTAVELRKIIEVDALFRDTQLIPFMEMSHELVDELCLDSGYTEARLTKIETWLAAHFYAIRDPRSTQESAGVSAQYESRVDLNLALTRYGQQVLLLDTGGNFAALNIQARDGKNKGYVQTTWLGTEL